MTRLAELQTLFVDVDFYKVVSAETHPRHVLDVATGAREDARIQPPSFALSTGRGLALVCQHTQLPRTALPRWRACQKQLFHILQHLGADRLASDAARVLRLAGTCNGRTGQLVEALTPVG